MYVLLEVSNVFETLELRPLYGVHITASANLDECGSYFPW
jgi:hypothetical protein